MNGDAKESIGIGKFIEAYKEGSKIIMENMYSYIASTHLYVYYTDFSFIKVRQ